MTCSLALQNPVMQIQRLSCVLADHKTITLVKVTLLMGHVRLQLSARSLSCMYRRDCLTADLSQSTSKHPNQESQGRSFRVVHSYSPVITLQSVLRPQESIVGHHDSPGPETSPWLIVETSQCLLELTQPPLLLEHESPLYQLDRRCGHFVKHFNSINLHAAQCTSCPSLNRNPDGVNFTHC